MDTDVLIIGAGPCGLMLANELGQRGIKVIVLDREAGVATAPQANATQARTMEHYRRLGFADEIRKLGLPAEYPTDVSYVTTLSGHELARHAMPPSGQADAFVRDNAHIWNAAEMPHRISQSLIEHSLWQHAIAHDGVTVEFNTEVTDFGQDAEGVTATLTQAGSDQTRRLRAAYLFAADGPRSMARKKLGIRYGGEDSAARDFFGGDMLSVYIDAPTFYERISVPKAWMYWTFNLRRRGVIAATDGKRLFSFATQLKSGEDGATMGEAEVRALVAQALGAEIPFTFTGTATWKAGRMLVAERFRAGRVLLGGDAVHLFTPTGGMGYNTAIEDAANAGWKLAAVIKGEAPAALLESYEAERRPVAERNTRFAGRFADSMGLFAPSPAIEDDGPAGDFARKRAGAYLGEHARNEFTIPGFTLGARYDGSPVIWPEASLNPPDAPSIYAPSAKPGGRAPHLWLPGGDSLFDRFGQDWTLLCLATDAQTVAAFNGAARARGLRLTVVDLSKNAIAADLYQCGFALIRPDQIVAWRGAATTAEEAAAVFDLVTGKWVAA